MQIGRGDLLDHFGAGIHFGEISGALCRAGRLPARDNRTGEEDLAELNLALGQFVARDEGKAGRHDAAGKQRREEFDDVGAEAQGDEILLVNAGVARECDGRQEILQRLVLLPLE